MNIFVLDEDINRCAAYMVDRHVVKMLTETAQILCAAYYFTGEAERSPYRLSHANHPCCAWARQSKSNWSWLRRLGLAMYGEYQYRYGDRIHKAGEVIKALEMPSLPDGAYTWPPACVPDSYKRSDVVQSYRAYYIGEKQHIFRWTRRSVPMWIGQGEMDGEHEHQSDIKSAV